MKMISANSISKRYCENELFKRCVIQYRSLCLYTANLGMPVYKEYKTLTDLLGEKRYDWQMLISCILGFGRKEHLVIYNKLNLLKTFVRKVYD